MKERLSTNLRKWICLILTVLIYYIVHEGAHMIYLLCIGTFRGIKFMGVGVQIVVDDSLMTNSRLSVFCLVGSLAALAAGYIVLLLSDKIVRSKSKYLKAADFYTSLVLPLLDPLYLSLLYRFFGGGGMNGLKLFGIPELVLQTIYGIIGVINLLIFIKIIYPKYKKAFSKA